MIAIVAMIAGSVAGLINPAGEGSSESQATEPTVEEQPNYEGELTLVYIGSSQCAFSNVDSISDFVSALIDRTESQASRRNLSFQSIGIGVDTDIKEGITHLTNTGNFNQVSVGAGWDNHSLRRYVTELTGGPLATPQMILVETPSFVIGGAKFDEGDHAQRLITESSVVYQAVGVGEIRGWANAQSVSQLKLMYNWNDYKRLRLDSHILGTSLDPGRLPGTYGIPEPAGSKEKR